MENINDDKDANKPAGSQPGETPKKDPSVENGEKIMEVQEKLDNQSEEDKKKDAENWRNEG